MLKICKEHVTHVKRTKKIGILCVICDTVLLSFKVVVNYVAFCQIQIPKIV